MSRQPAYKPRGKQCPVCHQEARKSEPLYDPKAYLGFHHWNCDRCKIGWFDKPGALGKVAGTPASLKAAYEPTRPNQGEKTGR